MKSIRTTSILALALCAAATLSSCENLRAKPGVDGTAYSLGHLDAMVHATPQRVIDAAISVLGELAIRIETSAASGLDGKVIGKTALDRRIEITVQRQDPETSKLSIQVGTFGEEALSREIYERIKAKL